MIPLTFLKQKNVAVLGLGKTGVATVKALQESGAHVVVWDDKEASCVALQHSHANVNIIPHEKWDWTSLDMLVMSPGIPLTHPKPHPAVLQAKRHQVEIVGDVELLFRACPSAGYIAITGTNGKSTTTSLIGHILQKAGVRCEVGGNLGEPVLTMEALGCYPERRQGSFDNATDSSSTTSPQNDSFYVLELSSYQLDLVRSTKFNVALLLNLSEDHLDRHGDMEGYMAANGHIFERQNGDDVAIVGVDDPYCESLARIMIDAQKQKLIPIGTTQTIGCGVFVRDGVIHNGLDEGVEPFDLRDIPTLQGTHNHQNSAAAYAACSAVGLPHEIIIQHMQSYPGLVHRMQLVGEVNGVRFVNDSKATNADAAARSLGSYDRILWIGGGIAKAGGIENLMPYFPRIEKAFLIGAAQDEFAATLEGRVAYEKSGTLTQAVGDAMDYIAQHDLSDVTLLLAPACASFDQFKSFEVRGDAFVGAVQTYMKKEMSNAV